MICEHLKQARNCMLWPFVSTEAVVCLKEVCVLCLRSKRGLVVEGRAS